MASAPALRKLRPFRSALFSYLYKPTYSISPEYAIQQKEQHPLAVRNLAIFKRRPKVGLWYRCPAVTRVAPKRLPRSHASRRLLQAFREALDANSLDQQGLVRKTPEVEHPQRDFVMRSPEDDPPPIDLRGVLLLLPTADVLTATRGELNEQAAGFVKYLMRHQWLDRAPDRGGDGGQQRHRTKRRSGPR